MTMCCSSLWEAERFDRQTPRAPPCGARIRARQAVRIATDCAFAGLSKDAASWVDTQVAVALLGGWAFKRIMRQLKRWIVKADPALGAEEAAHAKAVRRVDIVEHADGCGVLYGRLDTRSALALDATIGRLADTPKAHGDTPRASHSTARRATPLREPGRQPSPASDADLRLRRPEHHTQPRGNRTRPRPRVRGRPDR